MRRYDVQKIDGYEMTPQGFLKMPVYAGRTGIQVYRNKDGSELREYRPADEVFSRKTMDSLKSCPMTNDHPNTPVSPENAKGLMCGFTVDADPVVVDQKYQKTFVVIYDKSAIEDVKNGKREVSLGYDVDLDFTPGEVEGQKYDAIQRNIINNHLALVDRARGGREIRLRLDGQDAVLVTEGDNPQGDPMKIKIGDKEFEVTQEIADAYSAEQKAIGQKLKDAEDAAAKVSELSGSVTTLTSERDKLNAKVDALNEEIKKAGKQDGGKADQAQIDAAVIARRKVEKVAERVLPEAEFAKIDGMTNAEIKKAVILAHAKDTKLDGKSADYVDARFDLIGESVANSDGQRNDAGLRVVAGRKQAGKDSVDQDEAGKAREKSMKEDAELWRKPLGKTQ
jgi:hypothetical protein